ncbi:MULTISPECIES: hypothetical protein [Methylosinus]|uniref:Uncharacterized protein n=1 Tax=Methylosinus trichosporium (strain ATCC 35070 / NCIMB 11131 / UNIQEM 75 / OB3b) TaxID=595536 RepID=A0A2D2CXI8_METT3|nr:MULTISPECIES: hypothetical protein [Methylosinus]ATQ67359.1 hypothetical protein CQW49_05215 [Methylosinus trichosporium OB3b]OBS51627.1 hypothetical protein A8B73_15565 [Methylosinus sp. 3S-1]
MTMDNDDDERFASLWLIYERAFRAGHLAAGATLDAAEETLAIARPSMLRLYRGEDPGIVIFDLAAALRKEVAAARADRMRLLESASMGAIAN